MKRTLCLMLLTLVASTIAFGDIARPQPSKTPKQKASIDSTLSIRLSSDAKEAKLVIPKSQLRQLRAELERLDDGSDDTAVLETTSGVTRTQTIVSGAFLSLALVFGGMWLVRSGKSATKMGKTLVILTVIAGIGSAATLVYANAGPPPETRSITGKIFSQTVQSWKWGSGKIKVETKSEGDSIDLIVPDSPKTPKGEE
ncbi:MAG TPA: hypothetical protein PLD38_12925 [Pyrinomonadaceae bacterium]|nr:hypothetical protein [Chloracidobacterium sp.]MBP9935461.1 hypothetical protein [Pyrinomonadaceae bacterium]MBK9437933.1 hypothetical protein [Chloracidobacterium sp.]MBK9765640.1 hypothetical protein [Chloracidobacterium sp.]MBL0242228.1 hypothetical protein [Chloracidobacterium sp.]